MSWANSVTDAPDNPADTEPNHSGLLDQIPRLIDATPTILPEQSDEAIVPSMIETENNSWADKRQKGIREWADRTAHKIDNWFGKTDPDQPANATLRIILDNSWDKYETYEIKPRIRGKIKLPTLEQKLSLVLVMTVWITNWTPMLPLPMKILTMPGIRIWIFAVPVKTTAHLPYAGQNSPMVCLSIPT